MTNLKKKIGDFKVVPTLAIIMIGHNPDSEIYVKNKIFCEWNVVEKIVKKGKK